MIKTVEEFIRLRTSEDRDEYLRAANEEAPIEVWEKLIKEHEDMRQWVALNKKVPLSILEILSNDSDPQVRSCVALKRKLNRKLFEKLARDSDESVRMRIVRNPKTPEDIIKILYNDEWIEVRKAAEKRLLEMNK